jgi:hypothetical protein
MSGIAFRRTRAVWLGFVFIALFGCSTADRVAGPDQSTPSLAADRGLQ